MSTRILRLARFVLAAVAILAAWSSMVLAMQAFDMLIEPYRLSAALLAGLGSVALLVAVGRLVSGRSSGLLMVFASAAALPVILVLGLFRMGDSTLHEAVQQASCTSHILHIRICDVL